MKSVVVAVALVSVATACSVDGDAHRAPDLTGRVVGAEAFPYGPGTPVPAAQAAGAIADITFTPLHAENQPARCTPAGVDVAGAHLTVGPGGPAGGTLTVLLTRVGDTADAFARALTDCAEFTLGGTVGTTVTTRVLDSGDGFTISERELASGGRAYAHVYELTRQRADVRLYVQNRYSSTVLSADEKAATLALFDAASTAAFGS